LLEVESFGSELGVKDRFAEPARASAIDQEVEDARADPGVPKFGQNGHSANFYFAVPMLEHPAASDRYAVENGQCVKCVIVVGVHFDFFGYALLLDKDAAANRMGTLHVSGRFDRDHFDARSFTHKPVTSARWTHRQFYLEVKSGLCYAPVHRGDRDATIVRDSIGA
jgi:hypothetical protein